MSRRCFFFFLLCSVALAQNNGTSPSEVSPAQTPDSNPSSVSPSDGKNTPDSEKEKPKPPKWEKNGNIVSEISLDELREKDHVFIIDTPSEQVLEKFYELNPKGKTYDITKDLYKALKTLSESSNPDIKNLLDLGTSEKGSVSSELLRTRIQKMLDTHQFLEDQAVNTRLGWQELAKAAPKGSVLIENVDYTQSLRIVRSDVREDVIELSGRITVHFDNNKITANHIVLNTKTKYLTATGNLILENERVIMKGEKAVFNVIEQMGAVLEPWGLIDDIYIRGRIAKINNSSFFSLVDGSGSFDAGLPIFYLTATNSEYYGEKRVSMVNVVVKIHNQPLFYTPFFIVDPWGIRFKATYGFTQREGIFIQANATFFVPYANTVALDLNYYQKLGVYFRIKNAQRSSFQDYDLSLALAGFSSGFQEGDRYSIYQGNDLLTNSYFRSKLNYKHTFNLNTQETKEKGINSIISFEVQKTGKTDQKGDFFKNNDPYFTSDFEDRTPEQMSFDLFFRQDPSLQSEYGLSAKDKDYYAVTVAQTVPLSNFQLKTDFNYAVQKKNDLSIKDVRNSYFQYLTKITLPSISFKLSGVIDPVEQSTPNDEKGSDKNTKDKPERQETFADFFNRPRNVYGSVNYSIDASYTHSLLYKLNEKEEAEDFDRHLNNYNLNFSLSRLFKLEKTLRGNMILPLNMNFNFTVGNNFKGQWGGEEVVGSDNKTANEKNTYDELSFRHQLELYLPSQYYYDLASKKTGYLPMIPLASFKLDYNVVAREFINEANRKNKKHKPFGEPYEHTITLRPKIEQNGFGLFYIPYLDYHQSLEMYYQQALTSFVDANGVKTRYRYLSPFQKSQPFLRDWYLNYDLKLFVKPPRLNFNVVEMGYQYKHQFFEVTEKAMSNKPFSQTFSLAFNYIENNANKIFFTDLFSLKTSYNYFFNVKDYPKDSIDFLASFKFTVSKYFQVEMGTLSSVENAFRYVKKKAKELNTTHVNIFKDILDSGGFYSSAMQERSLFKLRRVYVSVYHDLKTWYLKFTYSLTPQPLTQNTSLKGFYFNHSFYMEIAMKQKFLGADQLNKLIKPWETTSVPKELDFIAD